MHEWDIATPAKLTVWSVLQGLVDPWEALASDVE